MGTPDFAVGILSSILKSNFEIAAVITAPDKPAGRGQKLKISAVKEYALEHNLRILQPVNLKDASFLEELKSLNANLHVVVAFRMLPELVWKMPEFGTFNLHASLLPDYRGAAPINWAIINGEAKTGVTTFFIDEKIDTGAIIMKSQTAIGDQETAGELHDRLMAIGSGLVIKTLDAIQNGSLTTVDQKDAKINKEAPKLNKDNTRIDWQRPVKEIYNQIRGLSPYPSAWTLFVDRDTEWNVKIYEAELIETEHNQPVGKIVTDKKEMRISADGGFIKIRSLQFPGKKKMAVAELLNGMTFSEAAKVL